MNIGKISGIVFLILLLTGCGQLELGIETPSPANSAGLLPTPTPTATSTVPTPTLKPPVQTTAVSDPTPVTTATNTPTPLPPATATPTTTPTRLINNPNPATATPAPWPEIFLFSVAPQNVQPGAALSLSWDALGDSAEICLVQGTSRDCRETAVADTLIWQLPAEIRSDFYVEIVVTRGEKVDRKQTPVYVSCSANNDWWFFASPPTNCPQGEVINTQAAMQTFEHGWMLWLGAEDVIYVFFNDSTMTQFHGDQLLGNTETGDGGVVPPAGFVAPIRGFGLVWRGETTNTPVPWIQDRIGWGLTPESGFETLYQYDTNGGFYVRDDNKRIIYVLPSFATWSVFQQDDE